MKIPHVLAFACFVVWTAHAEERHTGDRSRQLETLRAVLGKPDATFADLDAERLAREPILLVNTNAKSCWGISYIGTVRKTATATPDVLFFTDPNGNTVPMQLVPDVADPDRLAVYANVQNVPPLGTYRLTPKTGKPDEISSKLFVDAEKGEMGNAMFTLTLDPENTWITSLKVNDFPEEITCQHPKLPPNAFTAQRKAVATGPLVAIMQTRCAVNVISEEKLFSTTLHTVFADSTKILQNRETFLGEPIPRMQMMLLKSAPTIPNIEWKDFTLSDDPEDFYAVLVAPQCGINYVPFYTEDGRFCEWYWPFVATFDNGIARRFVAQVRRPLVMLPAAEAEEKETLIDLGDTDSVQTDVVRFAEDGKSLLVVLVNPTEETQVCSPVPRKPYSETRVFYADEEGKRGEPVELPIRLAPGARVALRFE